MISVYYCGNLATCCLYDHEFHVVISCVFRFHPRRRNFSLLEKESSSLIDCKAFSRFFSRCMKILEAYYF